MPTETDPNRPDEPHGPDGPDWTEALYRSGADEQPPPTLDAAIKVAAREHEQRWYASPGRLATLATAATLVVASMIAYHLPEPTEPIAEPAIEPATTAPAPKEMPPPMRPVPVVEEQTRERVVLRDTRALRATTPDRSAAPRLSAVGEVTGDEATPEAALEALIEACGEPPGTEADRELRSDERGWYLVVTTDSATLHLRCLEGRWQPTAPGSDEQ